MALALRADHFRKGSKAAVRIAKVMSDIRLEAGYRFAQGVPVRVRSRYLMESLSWLA
jgi:hypothetical protein